MYRNWILLPLVGKLVAAVRGCLTFLQGIAFWIAVLLPLAYLPLVTVGHAAVADPWIVGKLVAVNAAVLLVGHGYSSSSSEPRGEGR